MNFTVECPTCKKNLQLNYTEILAEPTSLTCCSCGTAPTPDIMTAYQNVGKTMLELQRCCNCDDKKNWLPK